jgi:hypothetical protein
MCGALAAAAVTVPAPAATDSPLAVPDTWADDSTLSWTPVRNARSYVILADAGGRVSQQVAACCSIRTGARTAASTTYYVRSDVLGSRWTRIWKRPKDRTTTSTPAPGGGPVATTSAQPTTEPTTSSDPTTTTTAPTTSNLPTTAPPTSNPGSGPVGTVAVSAVCDSIPALYPTAPAGAILVDPAVPGDLDSKTRAAPAGSTFWLRPGTHTLGSGQYDQVIPKDGNTFLGAPGAVLDGQGKNNFAFTQHARNVTISADFRAVGSGQGSCELVVEGAVVPPGDRGGCG